MAWSPLAGGQLFDQSNSDTAELRARLEAIAREHGLGSDAIAIAWLLKHPAGILPVLGTNSLERIERLSDATKVNLDRETWFELYTLACGHEVP